MKRTNAPIVIKPNQEVDIASTHVGCFPKMLILSHIHELPKEIAISSNANKNVPEIIIPVNGVH